jgi:hypothetical protein
LNDEVALRHQRKNYNTQIANDKQIPIINDPNPKRFGVGRLRFDN